MCLRLAAIFGSGEWGAGRRRYVWKYVYIVCGKAALARKADVNLLKVSKLGTLQRGAKSYQTGAKREPKRCKGPPKTLPGEHDRKREETGELPPRLLGTIKG